MYSHDSSASVCSPNELNEGSSLRGCKHLWQTKWTFNLLSPILTIIHDSDLKHKHPLLLVPCCGLLYQIVYSYLFITNDRKYNLFHYLYIIVFFRTHIYENKILHHWNPFKWGTKNQLNYWLNFLNFTRLFFTRMLQFLKVWVTEYLKKN